VARIKVEKQPAIFVQETRPNVVDEKFPIGGRPFNAVANVADPVKTDAVRSHEIEFPPEIGEGRLSLDPTDNARNIEERSGGAEERLVVGIKAENLVAEEFANVEKITGAAAKIDNPDWWRAIEPKILGALDIDLDPVNNIFETVDPRRAWPIGILLPQFLELRAIQCFQNAPFVDGMGSATEMFERAGEEIGRK